MPATTARKPSARKPVAPVAPVAPVVVSVPYVGALHYYSDNAAVAVALAARTPGVEAESVRRPVRAIVLRGDAAAVETAREIVAAYLASYDRELRTFKRTDPAYLACGPRTIDGRDAGRIERSRLERVFIAAYGAAYGTATPYAHAPAPVAAE